MDGNKTLVLDWQEILTQLRNSGREEAARKIESALQQGRRIQAIQLAKSCGIITSSD